MKELNIFELPTVNAAEINKIVKSWNTKKAMCSNAIPPKLLKIAADVTNFNITNILNEDFSNKDFQRKQ